MEINAAKFQKAFVQRANQVLREGPSTAVPIESAPPTDGVTLSARQSDPVALTFQAAVSAVATSASLGGVPGLAAMAQDVARSLVTSAEEVEASNRMTEQFSATLPRVEDPRVERAWNGVSRVTDSPFEPPLVFQSFFIDAHADARTMMIGTESLKADLADDTVLAFTIAHEEGHRQHRDTAGTAGLRALVKLCENDRELSDLAQGALSSGCLSNELAADQFAAEAMVELGLAKEPIMEFLGSLPGDSQHPVGVERAALVEKTYTP